MADSSSDESDAGFPSLPPSIMLDIDLGSGENDGENQYRVLSDETREEEFQPDIVVKDHDESSSSSSDNEDKVHGASVAVSSHENVMMKKKERQNNADTAGSKADNLVNVADGSTCFKCNDCKGFQMHQWRNPDNFLMGFNPYEQIVPLLASFPGNVSFLVKNRDKNQDISMQSFLR